MSEKVFSGTLIHEKMCNLAGKLSLLDELTSKKKLFSVDFANSEGDTLFHEITKLQPPATTPRLIEVTDLLMKKGYR